MLKHNTKMHIQCYWSHIILLCNTSYLLSTVEGKQWKGMLLNLTQFLVQILKFWHIRDISKYRYT